MVRIVRSAETAVANADYSAGSVGRIDVGCNRCDEGSYYIPPAGAYLSDILNLQVQNGEAALMVLHQFDFMPGDFRLNRHG